LLGNCANFLAASGVNASRVWVPSGLNNTFAILDFFSWCITGEQTARGFRYERSADGEIREWTPKGERDVCLAAFASAGAFVFTIGLAEVWQDRDTQQVFWRGVPTDVYNARRHVFRVTTVDENAANLRAVVSLIRRVNAHAPIVFTLSPVPLVPTHREVSCLTADCVSKSVLRVALDQVMSDQAPGVFYWPSFEIVKWVGANLPWSAFGDRGHAPGRQARTRLRHHQRLPGGLLHSPGVGGNARAIGGRGRFGAHITCEDGDGLSSQPQTPRHDFSNGAADGGKARVVAWPVISDSVLRPPDQAER